MCIINNFTFRFRTFQLLFVTHILFTIFQVYNSSHINICFGMELYFGRYLTATCALRHVEEICIITVTNVIKLDDE